MSRRYDTPAVVVGGGLNGLGVVRSLGRAGVDVIIVVDCDARAPAMLSRYARAVGYDRDAPDGLANALDDVGKDYVQELPVLILTTEEAVRLVVRHYDRLAQRFRMTLAPPKAVLACTHKCHVLDISQSAGLAHPRTASITHMADIERISTLRAPLIVKPARRDAGYARNFTKAYCVSDRASAITLVERMLETFADIIVQEWIPGADSDIYFCLQYRPAGIGVPISFVGRKLRSWPPRTGGTASCIAAPEAEEVIALTNAFFEEAGVSGLASMEFKKDSSDGRYVIVEPTVGRTDFQEEIATLNGINIPLTAYCDSLALDIPAECLSAPRIWRDRIGDARSAEDPLAEAVDRPPAVRTVDALYRWYDPWPGVVAVVDRIVKRVRRIGQARQG